jgi:hypothetical protein
MRAKRRRYAHRLRMDAPTPQRGTDHACERCSAPPSAPPQEEDGEAWHVTPAAWLLVPCGLPLS